MKQVIDLLLAQTHKSSLLSEPVNSANVLIEADEGFGKDYILMLEGKIHIRKYFLREKDMFEDALDDYYGHTYQLNMFPDEEDLEKMKITLNWLVKNRNKAKIYYLKNYNSKEELFAQLSKFSTRSVPPLESTFDIKNFLPIEEKGIKEEKIIQ
jgi:DNA polymerase-3 subunit epsilon